ncbi:MAG: hypothetical protein NVV72_10040 [Asticcacaulis sp.]|nr:hypothetical protein [Asticcacaulis sp.]
MSKEFQLLKSIFSWLRRTWLNIQLCLPHFNIVRSGGIIVTTYSVSFPGSILERGFWLYVWRVQTANGEELLYVGRTGDNSSPHATAPYTRMGQHLNFMENQNALRRQLANRGIVAEHCLNFELISHGPIYPEIERNEGDIPAVLMARHTPVRNLVGAMEKALADGLRDAGYDVMNTVSWKHGYDPDVWAMVRSAFTAHFPKLAGQK